jgi:hypothetical protein
VQAAQPGDTLHLQAGTYLETLTLDKDLTLRGDGPASTILDGSDAKTILTINADVTVTIRQVTLTHGASTLDQGGAIQNQGDLTLQDTLVSSNNAGQAGGGLMNFPGSTALIERCAFLNNTTNRGAGIFNQGTLTVHDTTFSGNTSFKGGGGVFNVQTATASILNCTFSGNTDEKTGLQGEDMHLGAGIANFGSLTLRNSLIAHSSHGNNCNGVLTSGGHNLSDDISCNLSGPGDQENVDPRTGPLQDNGGPTPSVALLPDSPAVDAGDSTDVSDTDTDQRGLPRIVGDDIDIGAYELQNNTLWTVSADSTGACTPDDRNCSSVGGALTAASPGDTILVKAGTYKENLNLAKAVTLKGEGEAKTILDGNKKDRVVGVATGITATIQDLTLTGGTATAGGGLLNAGTLYLQRLTFKSNHADEKGGGLANTGTLTADHLHFSQNDSTKHGAGLSNDASLTLTDSTMADNTAFFNGGGLFNDASARAKVQRCTFTRNEADRGGGVYNAGELNLEDSILSHHNVFEGGGAFLASGSILSNASIQRCTFISNSADRGGGVFNVSYASIYESTFFDNTSFRGGGAIRNATSTQTLNVFGSTLSGNTDNHTGLQGEDAHFGAGISNSTGTVTITETIIANSPHGGNCAGAITSNGHNLSSDKSCVNPGVNGDLSETDPHLSPLRDNGGYTPTFAPLPGSPAIGAGTTADYSRFETDQRGFPRIINGKVDIGSVQTRDVPSPTLKLSTANGFSWEIKLGKDVTAEEDHRDLIDPDTGFVPYPISESPSPWGAIDPASRIFGWVRLVFTMPDSLKPFRSQDLHLFGFTFEDVDTTYFNGYEIGATGFHSRTDVNDDTGFVSGIDDIRDYRIPNSIIRWDGTNVIAISGFVRGSSAESGGFSVQSPPILEPVPLRVIGDVNDDGKLDISDANLALRLAVGVPAGSGTNTDAADMNKDGNVDIRDVVLLLRKLVGL